MNSIELFTVNYNKFTNENIKYRLREMGTNRNVHGNESKIFTRILVWLYNNHVRWNKYEMVSCKPEPESAVLILLQLEIYIYLITVYNCNWV